jgi:hypothetical protein
MQQATTTYRISRAFAIGAVAGCGLLNLICGVYALAARPVLNSDFLAFWSFPRFAAGHDIFQIYDQASLAPFQHALAPGFSGYYALLYPPTLLLVTFWLKFFSFAAGETIWTGIGLGACVAAAWAFFAPGQRLAGMFAMLASPIALINGASGETGYLTTALLLAGFASLRARPVLAGIFFGLLTLKPQMAFLVPIALLAGGYWRALAVAALVAIMLIGLSMLVFPPALWWTWARSLTGYETSYLGHPRLEAQSGALSLNISVISNLLAAGAPHFFAWLAQILSSVAVAISVFWAWRVAPFEQAAAVLFAGIFLATPHTYAYDALPLIAALVLIGGAPASAARLWLGVLIFLSPLLVITPACHEFFYALPEALLFILALRLAFAVSQDQNRLL